jgi:S-adenosylmethionine decarboxylase proenzyme
MDARGRHMLVEYHGADPEVLQDAEGIRAVLVAAAEAAGTTVVQVVLHRFSPQGVSGVVLVEESHLSIHTWPETGYAAVDFYTCGDGDPEAAHAVLVAAFRPARWELMMVERGREGPEGLAVRQHRVGPRSGPPEGT